MSANLDLVRSIFTEWERGDFRNVRWAHPEIEYLVIAGPERGKWDGLAAMTASVRDYMTAWESYGMSAAELRDVDRDRVLALVRLGGRGKTSGIDLTDAVARVPRCGTCMTASSRAQMRFRGRASGIMVKSQFAQVITLPDRKGVRSEDYLSHQEALEAVGLSE